MGVLTDLKNKTIARYRKGAKEQGNTVQALEWASEKSQLQRFKQVRKIFGNMLPNEKTSVLDVGCGLGDLYGYLNREVFTNGSLEYRGYDITSELIAFAKERYPKAEFHTVDILTRVPFVKQWDYVFMIDILDTLCEDNWRVVKGMLFRAFAMSKKGLCASFLSGYADDDMMATDDQFYIEPEELFRYCKKLTPWVDMKHSHLPHNVVMYLYKEQQDG